jgi:hypothetical protein
MRLLYGLLAVALLSGAAWAASTGPTVPANGVNTASIQNGAVDLTTKVSGILPNANTTATNANTASTIVKRDASGNFSAGTITAALNGNANTATTAGNAGYLLAPLTTGRISVTGPGNGTTRVKTVRDADDTLLEAGGGTVGNAYQPNGYWDWTNGHVTWPTFNQSTSGNAATATALTTGDKAIIGNLTVGNPAGFDAEIIGQADKDLWISVPDSLTGSGTGPYLVAGSAQVGSNGSGGSINLNVGLKDGTGTDGYIVGNGILQLTNSGDGPGTITTLTDQPLNIPVSGTGKLSVARPAEFTGSLTGTLTGNASTVTGFSPTSGKTLSLLKTMSFTAADDTGVYTLPTGTATLLATNGSAASLTSFPTLNQATTANAGSASTVAIVDDTTTDADMYPTWTTTTTGNLPPKTSSSKLKFHPSTGLLTATTFVGALTGTASGNLTSGGALGTPASGTLSSCTGYASKVTKRVHTLQSGVTTIAVNSDTDDVTPATDTAAGGTLIVSADTGTAQTEGQALLLKITCTNAQTFSWTSGAKGYYGGTTALPTTTTGSGKVDYYAFIWDAVAGAWNYTGGAGGFAASH